MIPDLTPYYRNWYVARLEAITPESPKRWGKMDPAALFQHLRIAVECSLGFREDIPDKSIPAFRRLLRYLAFDLFPDWPGGIIPTAPGFVPRQTQNMEAERHQLIAALDAFLEEVARNPEEQRPHPLLGSQPLLYWRHIHGAHFCHHLRQFGQWEKNAPLPLLRGAEKPPEPEYAPAEGNLP